MRRKFIDGRLPRDERPIFSFLDMYTRKFPDPGSPRRRIVNQDHGSGTPIEMMVPDVERRRAHIDLVDPKHPLTDGAVTSCLAYAESERPCISTSDIAQKDLEIMRERVREISQELSEANEQLLNAELLKMQLLGKDMEVLSAKEDKRVAEEAMSKLQSELEVKDKELRAAESVKRELLDVKDGELRAAEESRKELYGHLRVKDEELKASEDSRRELQMQLKVKDDELKYSEESRRELQRQLSVKNDELLLVFEQLRNEQPVCEQNQINCTIDNGKMEEKDVGFVRWSNIDIV